MLSNDLRPVESLLFFFNFTKVIAGEDHFRIWFLNLPYGERTILLLSFSKTGKISGWWSEQKTVKINKLNGAVTDWFNNLSVTE